MLSQEQNQNRGSSLRKFINPALMCAVSGYLGYVVGNWYETERESEIRRIESSVSTLTTENQALTRKLNILNVELEVSRLANQDAQKLILEQELQHAEMARQIAFYQRVMAPEKTQEGFVIEAFDISPTLSPQVYRFDVALMQQTRNKAVVKGDLAVTISGSQDQRPMSYELGKLLTEQSKPLSFSFKYFQVLGGELTLPNGFQPDQIKVAAEIYQFKRKRGDIEVVLPWVVASKD